MDLVHLPTELFEAILHQAIIMRGIRRGLRLRLVSSAYLPTHFISKLIIVRVVRWGSDASDVQLPPLR
jgi:hypothetical protein